ncbi:MAG: stage II sporulation protein P [Clostridium fessum]
MECRSDISWVYADDLFKGLRYNLHLRPRSALIEVGAQTNTYEEAVNAMDPLAQLLDQVLTG